MNKCIRTTKPTQKGIHITQTEICKMTTYIQVRFYSSVLILNLNPKSNDELKSHVYVILSYI